ncbi:hypothetical protein ACFQ0K_08630 [Nocardioides caeni]|uniref:Uncharacterized protein n=1 Tax=Nocardioides caeni TaxID=574700 RepID=A0A4S8N6Y8_9ACTN|nr:hypothetical protein [Nocardioides caeni]THV10464.1 hypothetical protein E9934_14130 [Nocardioides caeni]
MTETTTAEPPLTEHACPGCGVRTEPDRGEPVVTVPVYAARPDGRIGRHIASAPLTRCAECRTLRDRARALLDAHPAVRGRLGNIADDRTEAALSALVLLGMPLPEKVTEADLSALLRHLAHPGGAARWEVGARPGKHAREAWSHVSESARADLRAAYAALLRERLTECSPDVALTSPTVHYWEPDVPAPGGCLLCGVGEVTVPAAQVARVGGREAAQRLVWRTLSASPGNLGGQRGPARVTGHVCPPCSEALDSVGAVGPTALERALAEHLTATGREAAAQRLRAALAHAVGRVPGLTGWGALVYAARARHATPPRPNAQPWAHLDLSELVA